MLSFMLTIMDGDTYGCPVDRYRRLHARRHLDEGSTGLAQRQHTCDTLRVFAVISLLHSKRLRTDSKHVSMAGNAGHSLGAAGVDGSIQHAAPVPGVGIVSGSQDETLRVWREDGAGGWRAPEVLSGHTEVVLCVAHVPGVGIVSGSQDATLCVWREDGAGGWCASPEVLRGHIWSVHCVAHLPRMLPTSVSGLLAALGHPQTAASSRDNLLTRLQGAMIQALPWFDIDMHATDRVASLDPRPIREGAPLPAQLSEASIEALQALAEYMQAVSGFSIDACRAVLDGSKSVESILHTLTRRDILQGLCSGLGTDVGASGLERWLREEVLPCALPDGASASAAAVRALRSIAAADDDVPLPDVHAAMHAMSGAGSVEGEGEEGGRAAQAVATHAGLLQALLQDAHATEQSALHCQCAVGATGSADQDAGYKQCLP